MASSITGHTKGFTLIEIVLAIALTALVVAGVSNGLIIADRVLAQLGGSVKARLLADECVAVIRWVRDAEAFEALSEGTHGLVRQDGAWSLSDAPDAQGAHTRSVIISDDGEFRKRVECTVAWGEPVRPASVSVMTFIGQ
jgi:prepilin-type N-terminal cleavage/methylation domain-containing protein